MAISEDVLQELLNLPEKERAKVALRVLQSLPHEDPRTNEEWLAEVERRARAAETEPGRDFDEVVAEIEAELG